MSFTLTCSHTFWLKVVFCLPEAATAVSSRMVERSFSAQIEATGVEADEPKPGFSRIVNWEGVTDDAGMPVPFTEENLRILRAHPYAGVALRDAWASSLPD